MLNVAVIDDEVKALVEITAKALTFSGADKIRVKPFWVNNEDNPRPAYDSQMEYWLKKLRSKGIDKGPEDVEIIQDLRNPANFQKLVNSLKNFEANLVFCDAGMGGASGDLEIGVLIVNEMSEHFANEYQWNCWIVSQFEIDEIERDVDMPTGEFKLKSRHIDKAEILGCEEGECPSIFVDIFNKALKEVSEVGTNSSSIIGESTKILACIKEARRFADYNENILILGENGTGKDLFARLIHDNSSRRAQPLVIVNSAAIPDDLWESQLFGHEKGAFTNAISAHDGFFERAEGGTLFLDEIGEMPLAIQAKLTRVIEYGEYSKVGGKKSLEANVRVIAATNIASNIPEFKNLIKDGRFREDIFHRFPQKLTLPPLRERIEDVRLLADHFRQKFNEEYGKNVQAFSEDAMAKLENYSYPGNVRELEGIVAVAFTRMMGKVIDDYDLKGFPFDNDDSLFSASRDHLNISSVQCDLEHGHISPAIAWKIIRENDLCLDLDFKDKRQTWAKKHRQLASEILDAAIQDLGHIPTYDAENEIDEAKKYFNSTYGALKERKSREKRSSK